MTNCWSVLGLFGGTRYYTRDKEYYVYTRFSFQKPFVQSVMKLGLVTTSLLDAQLGSKFARINSFVKAKVCSQSESRHAWNGEHACTVPGDLSAVQKTSVAHRFGTITDLGCSQTLSKIKPARKYISGAFVEIICCHHCQSDSGNVPRPRIQPKAPCSWMQRSLS